MSSKSLLLGTLSVLAFSAAFSAYAVEQTTTRTQTVSTTEPDQYEHHAFYTKHHPFKTSYYVNAKFGIADTRTNWDSIVTVNSFDPAINPAVQLLLDTEPYQITRSIAEYTGSLSLGGVYVDHRAFLGAELTGGTTGRGHFKIDTAETNLEYFALESTITNNQTHSEIHMEPFELDLDLRPGFLVQRNFALYGRIGAAWNRLSIENTVFAQLNTIDPAEVAQASGASARKRNVVGARVGVGTEYLFSKNLALSLDYVYTNYGNIRRTTSASGTTDAGTRIVSIFQDTHASITRQTATIGLSCYF